MPKDRQIMADNGIQVQAINMRSDVEDFFDSYDVENLGDVEEVHNYITELGDLKRDFDKLLNDLNDRFKHASQKLSDIKKSKKQDEKEEFEKEMLVEEYRSSQAKLEEQTKINNLMVCAENQHFEIKIRYETLKKKCLVNVRTLSDYEVIDLKKREENLHMELRVIR